MTSSSSHTPADLAKTGFEYYQGGNLPQAELIARQLIREHPASAEGHLLLGLIALWIRMYGLAAEKARLVLSIDPVNATARQLLEQGSRPPDAASQNQPVKSRFLLIKAWGFGLWADVDHVLGQLLLAEITGRIPVVHWGSNSRFRNSDADNAFEALFDPVSTCRFADLAGKGLSYFPPKWSEKNLAVNDLGRWDGPYSGMTGLYFLNRPEDVVVSDFHTYLTHLVPWIPACHPFFGLSPQEIYRRLVAGYLRPRRDILDAVEHFWQQHMKDKHVMAVHVRGSDKAIEIPGLEQINASYHLRIRDYLGKHPEAVIFLLTDSRDMLRIYQQEYGTRLIHTDSLRTETDEGLHYQNHDDRRRLGAEVIRDAFLAARCRYFIGNGGSNVSTSVLHLRDWDPAEYELVHPNLLFSP